MHADEKLIKHGFSSAQCQYYVKTQSYSSWYMLISFCISVFSSTAHVFLQDCDLIWAQVYSVPISCKKVIKVNLVQPSHICTHPALGHVGDYETVIEVARSSSYAAAMLKANPRLCSLMSFHKWLSNTILQMRVECWNSTYDLSLISPITLHWHQATVRTLKRSPRRQDGEALCL